MSCTPTCAGGNASRRSNASPGAPNTSHRTVHLSLDRSGVCPGMPQNISGNIESASPFPQYYSPMSRVTQRQSTPGPYGYPGQHETFGSQIDYNLSWMPKDINLSDLLDQSVQPSSRFRRFEQNVNPLSSQFMEQSLDPNASPLLPGEQEKAEAEGGDKEKVKQEREESLMEWFDRTVENELKKRKEKSSDAGSFSPIQQQQQDVPERELGLAKNMLGKIGEASATEVEIITQMRMQPDTDLTDAVDKLAKAEAMCQFAGAVKAAEKAAESAPPGLAEEAAVASARMFHADMKATSNLNQTLDGVRPLEVVGYVGVTNPKFPVKPRKKECERKC